MGYFIVWLAFVGLTVKVASDKGRDPIGWLLIGLLLGPIALLMIFIVEPDQNQIIKSGHKKKCPFCAELINDEAIKCKHCGEAQSTISPENLNEKDLTDLINRIQNKK
jgi:hypothetical protein